MNLTLWQSPTLMNVSGPTLARAFRAWRQQHLGSGREGEGRLVILHDELEAPLGALKVRPGTTSARGHNGLRSVAEVLRGDDFVKIGIGIGRGASRDKGDVADFVLREMRPSEREKIEGKAEQVLRLLKGISTAQR